MMKSRTKRNKDTFSNDFVSAVQWFGVALISALLLLTFALVILQLLKQ